MPALQQPNNEAATSPPEAFRHGALQDITAAFDSPVVWFPAPGFTPDVMPEATQLRGSTQTAVLIGDMLDDRIYFKQPINLQVEAEGDYFVAKCDEFEQFGYGHDLTAAIDDFRQTMAELYWTLKEDRERLGPAMKSLWGKLHLVVAER